MTNAGNQALSMRGVTLLELLMVLAILAVMTSLVGIAVQQSGIGARLRLERVTQQLVSDLVVCRDQSEYSKDPCSLEILPNGYRMGPEDLVKTWPQKVTSTQQGRVVFRGGEPEQGYQFTFAGGGRRIQLHVEPYTGRVVRHVQ